MDENKGILDLDSLPLFGCLTKLKFTTRNVDLDSEAFQVLISKCSIIRSLEFDAVIVLLLSFTPSSSSRISLTV